MALPSLTAVISPVPETVATDSLLDDQTTSVEVDSLGIIEATKTSFLPSVIPVGGINLS